jgi:hypothetical protein
MKRLLLTLLLCLALTSCGWQGGYRYPCQDPVNWEAVECVPPICEASGTCTKDILNGTISTTTP